MADVFISYTKRDRAVAEGLADDLKIAGFDVWWDIQLYAGDYFHDRIRSQIAMAKAVVVIWSDTAVASRWVRGEALEADDQGKLVSTALSEFDTKKLPINFLEMHCEPVTNLPRIIAAIAHKGASPRIEGPSPDELADLRHRVARGDAEAQVELGIKFDNGLDGLPKNDRMATRLYRLAAEQGNAWGQVNLAVNYREGLGGLPQNLREAAKLFKLAADQGHPRGQSCLGFFYKRGLGGLEINEQEAARLLELAANQGDYWGQYNLGDLYERGRGGLPKDISEAERLYKLAADQGDDNAKIALSRIKARG